MKRAKKEAERLAKKAAPADGRGQGKTAAKA
jgi:hypothetical protein